MSYRPHGRRRAFHVPAGSLSRYYAGVAAHASALAEIVICGDSTWAGQNNDSATYGNYSPATRLRELFAAASYTDGGHGHNNGVNDTPSVSGDSASGISIGTVTNYTTQFALPGESIASQGVSDTWTYTVTGSHLRIFYSTFNTLSAVFTYSIDGGSAVTVDPGITGIGGTVDPLFQFIDIPGLANTQHTVTITNTATAPLIAPTPSASGPFGSGGSLAAGTYYYKITLDAGSGESLPGSAIGPITVTAGKKVFIQVAAAGTGNTLRYYRSTSSGGTYALIGSTAGSGSATEFDDDGTAVPGAAPPTVGVSDSSRKYAFTNVDGLRAQGVVLHNQAVRASLSDFTAANGAGKKRLAVQLGITLPTQSSLASQGTKSAATGVRAPCAAIFAFGINNPDATVLFNDAVEFARACRVANCDPIFSIQHFDYQASTAPAKRQAILDAATQEKAAYCDLGVYGALGPFAGWSGAGYGGGSNNPHLNKVAYVAQAEYLWAKVLNPALAYA